MPRAIQEILDELLGHEDQAGVATALTNSDHDTLKTFRSKQFASGKTEGEKTLKSLKSKAASAETLDDLIEIGSTLGVSEENVGKIRSTVPDRVALENEVKGRFEGKLTEAKKKIEKLTTANVENARNREVARALSFMTATGTTLEALRKKYKDRTGVNLGEVFPEYAETIAAAKIRDRIRVDEEGNITDVYKLGEDTGYDAPTTEDKLVLLASDMKKQTPAIFVASKAEGGAGVRGASSGGSSGSGPSADSVVATKKVDPAYAVL